MNDQFYVYRDGSVKVTAATCVIAGFSRNETAFCNAMMFMEEGKNTRVEPSEECSENFDIEDFRPVCTARVLSEDGRAISGSINDLTDEERACLRRTFVLSADATDKDMQIILAHAALTWRFDYESEKTKEAA